MYKKILTLILILTIATSMKMTIQLRSQQKHCFYQILQVNQKYSVDTIPKTSNTYQVEISHMLDGQWSAAYSKSTNMSYQNLNVHKLASASSTYSICFTNLEQELLRLSVEIQSGLELMEFQVLPDKNDAENLDREIRWIDGQKKTLFDTLERMESLRASTEGLTGMMSTKMIGFAIIGLLSVVLVNFIFYKELKKTFKERKLI